LIDDSSPLSLFLSFSLSLFALGNHGAVGQKRRIIPSIPAGKASPEKSDVSARKRDSVRAAESWTDNADEITFSARAFLTPVEQQQKLIKAYFEIPRARSSRLLHYAAVKRINIHVLPVSSPPDLLGPSLDDRFSYESRHD